MYLRIFILILLLVYIRSSNYYLIRFGRGVFGHLQAYEETLQNEILKEGDGGRREIQDYLHRMTTILKDRYNLYNGNAKIFPLQLKRVTTIKNFTFYFRIDR